MTETSQHHTQDQPRPTSADPGKNGDLKALVDAGTWFCTMALPAPSHHPDSAHRFASEWANARSEMAPDWDVEELAELDAVVAARPHDGGASVILVHPRGGSTWASPEIVESC